MSKLHGWAFIAGLLLSACGPTDTGETQTGAVTEALAPDGSNAQVVGITNLPATLFPGERRLIGVTMLNDGTASPANDWGTSGPAYALHADTGSWGWLYNYVHAPIAVHSSNTFYIGITAPQTSQAFSGHMAAVGQGSFGDPATVAVSMTAPKPQWGCTLVPGSSTIPTTLAPLENRYVTFAVQNTGTDPWGATGMSLRSTDSPTNLWNQTTVFLSSAVAVGGVASFGFSIRAPATPGTYTFNREMFNQNQMGFFRSYGFCVSQTITVGGTPALDAAIGGQSFPATMAPGEVAPARVTMNNTGSEAWASDGNYMLYSLSVPTNLWGVTQRNVATATVAGGSITFDFTVTAPGTPGSYTQKWQMRKVSGSNAGFYGAIVSVPVTVDANATPVYGAAVVSQSIPAALAPGQNNTFSVTMRNSGSTPWTGSNFMLHSASTPPNLWGATQVSLGPSEVVQPNAQRVFNLFVKSPPTAGAYASSWRMWQAGGIGFFGEEASKTLIVSANCSSGSSPAGTYHLQLHGTILISTGQIDNSCIDTTTVQDGSITLTITAFDGVIGSDGNPTWFLAAQLDDTILDLDGFGTHSITYPQQTYYGASGPTSDGQPAQLAWSYLTARGEESLIVFLDTVSGAVTSVTKESDSSGINCDHWHTTLNGGGPRVCAATASVAGQ